MERRSSLVAVLSLAGALFGAACSNSGIAPSPRPTCGPPPAGPDDTIYLAYPMPGATGLDPEFGELVVGGIASSSTVVNIANVSGGVVAMSTVAPTPSPLPSPLATPVGYSGNVPLYGVPIPALSPASTYSVTYTYGTYDSENPPTCHAQVTSSSIGTFSTR